MVDQALVDNLYRLLLITAMVINLVLLVNNFVIYRRKIKDDISLLLIFGFVMTAFEIAWDSIEGNKSLGVLTYIFAIGYTMSFMILATFFNRFFVRFFNFVPKKKWILLLIYGITNLAFLILGVTTPWTGLLFSLKEDGFLAEGILFQTAFIIVVLLLFVSSMIMAIIHLIKIKGQNKSAKRITIMLIGFVAITIAFWVLQLLILGVESDYVALSLCISIALMFLISNLNTELLMESQAKIKEVETDLKIASKIQESALPSAKPNYEDKFSIALRASMNTAKEVGGDFYDYFPIDDKRICFLIADVSGKGTPAALFMMTAKTVIKDHALIYDDTSKILTLSNNRLVEGNKETMFATCWIAILDTETMILEFTNAGHNHPLLYQSSSGVRYVKSDADLIVGIMDGINYRDNTIQLAKGDRLLLYTDGVTEAHNKKDELYGEERLMKVFTENANKSEEEAIQAIIDDVNKFANGRGQFDDITMMVLTIK